jgi:protein SCO1
MIGRISNDGRPRIRWALFASAFALTALVMTFVTRPGGAASFHGTEYPGDDPAPEFSLVDHHGEPRSLADHRGETVLLFFGFARCPDVCPLTLERLRRALDEMGSAADRARVLLVTVDPEHDTPAVLAEYAAQFGERVTALTGEPEELAAMRRAYGVYAESVPSSAVHGAHAHAHAPPTGTDAPMVMHTDAIFGIDRAGRIRVLLHPDGPEDEFRADLRTLLAL